MLLVNRIFPLFLSPSSRDGDFSLLSSPPPGYGGKKKKHDTVRHLSSHWTQIYLWFIIFCTCSHNDSSINRQRHLLTDGFWARELRSKRAVWDVLISIMVGLSFQSAISDWLSLEFAGSQHWRQRCTNNKKLWAASIEKKESRASDQGPQKSMIRFLENGGTPGMCLLHWCFSVTCIRKCRRKSFLHRV